MIPTPTPVEVPDIDILSVWRPHSRPIADGKVISDGPIFPIRYLNQLRINNPRVPRTLRGIVEVGLDEILKIPGFGVEVRKGCQAAVSWAVENRQLFSTLSPEMGTSTGSAYRLSSLISSFEFSLSHTTQTLLRVVHYSSEPLSRKELSESLLVSKRTVTRERVRQLLKKATDDVRRAFRGSQGAELAQTLRELVEYCPEWRLVEGIRSQLDSSRPIWWEPDLEPQAQLDLLVRALTLAKLGLRALDLSVEFHDPQWVAYRPHALQDGEPFTDLDDLIVDGIIGFDSLHDRLNRAQLSDSETEWLLNRWGICYLHGAYVLRNQTIPDQVVTTLKLVGEPLSADDLTAHVSSSRDTPISRTYLVNSISRDPRLQFVQRQQQIALREWGLPEHSSLSALLQDELQRHNGRCRTVDLIKSVCETGNYSPNSVRAYLSSPLYLNSEGETFLRPISNLPRYPIPALPSSRSIREIKPGVIELQIEVDRDIARGSGAAIGRELALNLGVQPGEHVTFGKPATSITFYWHPDQPQPHRTSLRPLLESKGLNHNGLKLRLILNTHTKSVLVETE